MRSRTKSLISVATILVVCGILYMVGDPFAEGQPEAAGAVRIVAPDKPALPAARPPSAIAALPVGEPAPASLSAALGLPPSATVRNVVKHDEQYGIMCGEVSRDGSGGGFRRFLYVGAALSAEVDDGSGEFEQRVRDVCKRQP